MKVECGCSFDTVVTGAWMPHHYVLLYGVRGSEVNGVPQWGEVGFYGG